MISLSEVAIEVLESAVDLMGAEISTVPRDDIGLPLTPAGHDTIANLQLAIHSITKAIHMIAAPRGEL